jgi:hypothetical protein
MLCFSSTSKWSPVKYILVGHNNMDQNKQEQPREQGNHAPTGTQANGENQIWPLSYPLIHRGGASGLSYLSRDHFQHFSHNFFSQQEL